MVEPLARAVGTVLGALVLVADNQLLGTDPAFCPSGILPPPSPGAPTPAVVQP
jgi:hypothetical protein